MALVITTEKHERRDDLWSIDVQVAGHPGLGIAAETEVACVWKVGDGVRGLLKRIARPDVKEGSPEKNDPSN
jgi:hypothetical protein